ncbi:hypothetical protein KN815_44945 [Streptomyces sp. 4503]|uniref:Uncharacterized protein n=1 Tax=Streptomyces niphimycinicus TaxID=2842201 RepID=A0ABS6CVG3_9ACTN|nr:hypothetical protein [Streptomyces niphimycinicus]MBU3870947.1 hypothetical protein [Streptomyces niphimycinicus]
MDPGFAVCDFVDPDFTVCDFVDPDFTVCDFVDPDFTVCDFVVRAPFARAPPARGPLFWPLARFSPLACFWPLAFFWPTVVREPSLGFFSPDAARFSAVRFTVVLLSVVLLSVVLLSVVLLSAVLLSAVRRISHPAMLITGTPSRPWLCCRGAVVAVPSVRVRRRSPSFVFAACP